MRTLVQALHPLAFTFQLLGPFRINRPNFADQMIQFCNRRWIVFIVHQDSGQGSFDIRIRTPRCDAQPLRF